MSRTCDVDGCSKASTRRGMCPAHYQRWRTTGDVMADVPLRPRSAHQGPCSIDGCDRIRLGHGLCKTHLERQKRYGDPEAKGEIRGRRRKGLSLSDVFALTMPGSPPPEGVPWLWRGAVGSHGYGELRHENTHWLAHRVSFTIFVGPIPTGMHIRHKNDIPLDVNPHNLELGTAADNSRDKVSRSRQARGSNLPHHKLTEGAVQQARRLYAEQNYSGRELARIFRVSPATMGSLLRGETWKHVL